MTGDSSGGTQSPSRARAFVRKVFTAPSSVLAAVSIGTVLVRMVSTVALTRLLTPNDFGLIGIVNSLFFTIALLTDLGFQAYIIRHERGDERLFRDVLWTIHASRGVVLTGVSLLGAPILALLLQKPDLAAPLAVAAVTFAVNGLSSMSLITSLRSNGANRLSVLDFLLVVFQTVVSIALALVLRSVWALIFAMIAHSLARTFLSYAVFTDSRHNIARDQTISREFLLFSRVVLVSGFLTLLVGQADKLFLARVMSLAEFGTYTIALNLLSAPLAFAATYISRVVYPTYALTFLRDPDRVAQIYYSARQRISLLYGFGVGGAGGAAALIIRVLYDPRYADASIYLALLAVGVALRLPNVAAAEMMTALGRIKVTVRLNVVRVVWLALAAPVGFYLGGPLAVVAAVGLVEFPALLESWRILYRAGIFSARHEVAYLGAIAAGAVVGLAGSWLLLPLLPV